MDFTLSDYAFFLTVKAYLPELITITILLIVICLFIMMWKQLNNNFDNYSESQNNLIREGLGQANNFVNRSVARNNKMMDVEQAVLVIQNGDSECDLKAFVVPTWGEMMVGGQIYYCQIIISICNPHHRCQKFHH